MSIRSGVHGHAWSDRPREREAAPGLRRLGDEQAFLGTNHENDSFLHVETPEWNGRIVVGHTTSVSKDPVRCCDNQPPETAGRMMISSPGRSVVSSPSRSRMWSLFTNKFTCRRTAPVSSQMPRYKEGCRRPVDERRAHARGRGAQAQTPLQARAASHATTGLDCWRGLTENITIHVGRSRAPAAACNGARGVAPTADIPCTAPVSSQMRDNEAMLSSSSSSTARTLGAESTSSDAPLQQARSSRGTWIVMFFDRAMANQVRDVREVHAFAREIFQVVTRPAAISSGRDETQKS